MGFIFKIRFGKPAPGVTVALLREVHADADHCPPFHHYPHAMDTIFWVLLTLAVTLLGATWHAHRIGNERRDVALLGLFAGLIGVGSLASAAH
jgi:hypothetical protein